MQWLSETPLANSPKVDLQHALKAINDGNENNNIHCPTLKTLCR